MRKFQIGDKVEFEVKRRLDGRIYLLTGKVVKAGKEGLMVESIGTDVSIWAWCQPGRPDTAYGKPGYLRLVETEEITASSLPIEEKTCTCSSMNLFNYGCCCGGK